jgi:hypothetical protein
MITFMLIIIPGAVLISLKQVKAAKALGYSFILFACMHILVWGLMPPAIKLVVDYDYTYYESTEL